MQQIVMLKRTFGWLLVEYSLIFFWTDRFQEEKEEEGLEA